MRSYSERTENIDKKLKTEKKKRSARVALISGLSCVLALLLVFNLVLFVPYTTGGPPDLAQYKGSEYYPVMKKLSSFLFDAPETKNNFERWGIKDMFDAFGGLEGNTGASPEAPDASGPSAGAPGESDNGYQEVTDNQVDGVIEGDLFKRSKDTLFYLARKSAYVDYEDGNYETGKKVEHPASLLLRAYSIAGEDSALLSELSIQPESGFTYAAYLDESEMFLSADCKTVTVLTPAYNTDSRRVYTAVITVSTENPHTMSVTEVQYVSGSYVSSRMQNGVLLLVNNFTVYRAPDFSDEANFLPQYGGANSLRSLPMESIYLPETATRANYTVLATFDTALGTLIDAEALFSFSDEVYVAANNIYVTNEYRTRRTYSYIPSYNGTATMDNAYQPTITEITRISYDAGELGFGASTTLEGTVNNRYSMDEFEGNFRVFVTSGSQPDIGDDGLSHGWLPESASLYVFDAQTMTKLASVERFSPAGESVQSARFYGNTAYACTAEIVMMTDPVYAFDLSDLSNITYKDTGTIPGYSLNLTAFKDGTLLGIGYGTNSWWNRLLKIEVYAETESAVESIDAFEEDAGFSTDYKAYFIDREEGLVGLGIHSYETGRAEYLLLRFDGYRLTEILRTDMEGGSYDRVRAFYEDGYLYIVDGDGLKAEQII